MLKRLTVHLENVAPVRVNTGKRLQLKNNKTVEETKLILNNTISVRNLTSQPGIDLALYNIRKDHNIAKCSNNKRSQWKFDQEMWYTSNETL